MQWKGEETEGSLEWRAKKWKYVDGVLTVIVYIFVLFFNIWSYLQAYCLKKTNMIAFEILSYHFAISFYTPPDLSTFRKI